MRFILFICCFLIHSLAFAEEPGGAAGEVRGLDGKPAAGVRVAVAYVDQNDDGIRVPARSSQFAAITDALGRYRVTNITSGRHFLIAGRIDEPTFYPGTKNVSEAQLVTIPSGSVTEGLNFQLVQDPGVKLSGRIVAEGLPMPKKITLFANAPFWFREDVAVEADGSFTFHSLPPDSYDLSTFADAFLWNAASVVVRDKDVTGVRLVATPLVQLNGWVEVEGGNALPRIQLEVKGKPGKGAAGVSVDQDTGVFYMTLSVGEYRIAVRNLPKDYRVTSFKYGNTDLLRSAIRVVGGVQRFTLKLASAQPSKMRRIRGRITGVENIATSAEVTLYGNSLLIPLRAPINDEGSFAFTHITSGTYTLEAGSERKTIIVGNADIENADVFVPARRYLTGRVVVADGGQAPRVYISFVRDAMVTYSGSRSPGTFEGPLADGEYRIRVSGFPTEIYEIQSITAGTSDLLREPFRVTGEDVPEVVVTLAVTRRSVKVAGRVLDESGLPVFDALNPKLTLWNGSITMTAVVGPDGSFEFPKVPPGAYDVSSSRGAQTPLTVAGEDLLGIEIRPITRQSLAATYTPAAAPPPAAERNVRLHGRVTAPQGEMPSTIQLNGNTETLSATVDRNGKFEFPEIAPGVYSFYPTGTNVGFLPRHVIVGTRNTGPIDVTIPAIRNVRGRVLIDGEGPLPRAMFRVTPVTVPPVTSTAAARAFYASDGVFDLTLPVGEYQVDMMRLPAPYRVKSIRYGSADLMRQTLRVTDSSPEDIVITLATVPAAQWFRVSGRVTGSDRLPSSPKVILTGEAVRFFIESRIDPSGSFTFPKVPPGRYTLRTEPRVYGMMDRTVLIDRDIAALELTVPVQRPLTVRIKTEGGGKRPGFPVSLIHIDGRGFSFAFPSGLTAPLITQRTDFECVSDVCSRPPAGRMLNEPVVVAGASTPETFTLRVPEGEYRMAIGGIFEGYRVKSLTFGSANVLNEFFKVAGEESPELIVTLGLN